jgi:hypothetical protein
MKLRGFYFIFIMLLVAPSACSYTCGARKDNNTVKPKDLSAKAEKQAVHLKEPSKLSPGLSKLYKESKGNERIGVLVRTTAPLTMDQRKGLSNQGIRVGTVSDDVFTADIQLKDVPLLTEKVYIKFIELSKRLNLLK